MALSSADVLAELDRFAGDPSFPAFDNANLLVYGQRLHVLRSADAWAIAFELGCLMPAAGVLEATGAHLHRYGSAVVGEPGCSTGDVSFAVEPGSGAPFFVDEFDELVNSAATSIRIRGVEVAISADPAWYAQAGIALKDPSRPRVIELLRALDARHGELLRAPDAFVQARLASPLPVILALREWRHPDVLGGETPSASEALRQIARVIETGDARHYAPTEAPNTRWTNWELAGCNTAWDPCPTS